jgi:hypothetical protein
MDISLGLDGKIETVQAVFQDEIVPRSGWRPAVERAIGLPTFEIAPWSDGRYLDVCIEVGAFRLDSDELLLFMEDQEPARLLSLGVGLAVGLDRDDRLSHLIVGPLGHEHWRVLDRSTTQR